MVSFQETRRQTASSYLIVVTAMINGITNRWRIQRGEAVRRLPPLAHIFFQKAAFFRENAYISLCAFAINEDGADKLSFEIFGSVTVTNAHTIRYGETIKGLFSVALQLTKVKEVLRELLNTALVDVTKLSRTEGAVLKT